MKQINENASKKASEVQEKFMADSYFCCHFLYF